MSLLGLMRNSYARLISTYPKHCLVFIVFIILLSGFIAKDIQIDNNFAALFATDNNEMAFRHIYRQEFSADDNQLIAIVEKKNISESALVKLIEDSPTAQGKSRVLRGSCRQLKSLSFGRIIMIFILIRCLVLVLKPIKRLPSA